jgi:hypothetical protein
MTTCDLGPHEQWYKKFEFHAEDECVFQFVFLRCVEEEMWDVPILYQRNSSKYLKDF